MNHMHLTLVVVYEALCVRKHLRQKHCRDVSRVLFIFLQSTRVSKSRLKSPTSTKRGHETAAKKVSACVAISDSPAVCVGGAIS